MSSRTVICRSLYFTKKILTSCLIVFIPDMGPSNLTVSSSRKMILSAAQLRVLEIRKSIRNRTIVERGDSPGDLWSIACTLENIFPCGKRKTNIDMEYVRDLECVLDYANACLRIVQCRYLKKATVFKYILRRILTLMDKTLQDVYTLAKHSVTAHKWNHCDCLPELNRGLDRYINLVLLQKNYTFWHFHFIR